MTETGPPGPLLRATGASQFEKPEATFFNLEFPHNTFQLRHPLFDPPSGRCPKREIWGPSGAGPGCRRRRGPAAAARRCRIQGWGLHRRVLPGPRPPTRCWPRRLYVLYETLGTHTARRLAKRRRTVGLAQKAFLTYPDAVRRAGHADGNALFDAILNGRSGVTFTEHEYADDWTLISHPDRKIALSMPELLDDIRNLQELRPGWTTAEFPMVLSAGERRAYTANDIFRDPSGANATGTARCGQFPRRRRAGPDRMTARPHHHGRGKPRPRGGLGRGHAGGSCRFAQRIRPDFTGADGVERTPGGANAPHPADWCDSYAGTPWHATCRRDRGWFPTLSAS